MPAWETYIRRVEPYVPGEQPKRRDIVKLNTNENPYPPSPLAEEALARLSADTMRLYPDPTASELVDAIAAAHGVKPSQVFPGVGSDDVIAMAFLTFFNSEKPILFPDISYSFYSVWAELYRIPYECPALDAEFRIVPEDYMRESGGIIFPNPNAPTSLYMPLAEVERIVAANPDVIVMVDEAYVDFVDVEGAAGSAPAGPAPVSVLSLLDRYENLLVIRTFSKSRSMAGMRIGYAVGSEALIRALNDVKYSFNSYTLNRDAIAAGAAAISDGQYFLDTRRKILATRARACGEFRALGFDFPEPSGNFLFVRHKERHAAEIFAALKERGIYVRYFAKPRIDEYLRVTVGTDGQMDTLFAALREILG